MYYYVLVDRSESIVESVIILVESEVFLEHLIKVCRFFDLVRLVVL